MGISQTKVFLMRRKVMDKPEQLEPGAHVKHGVKKGFGSFRCCQLGGRKSVTVGLFEGDYGGIMFTTPIEKKDFRDGNLQPRARSQRHKNQLQTRIGLSREVLRALRDILNGMTI
jgi:hypothetical protein